ncbi:MAG: helix-turn-helix domain-containing protein [Acutalibacteraceae bacterium]
MFGTRLRELRTSLKLNQVEFGQSLSVTKQSVSNWENGNIQPSIDMLIKIATEYSVSTDYLLGLDERRTLDVTGLTALQIGHLQSLIDDLKSENN